MFDSHGLYRDCDGDADGAFGHLALTMLRTYGSLFRIKDLVLGLQDACRVSDALGAPLAYRPQGQDPLDVERVQLVGVSQGLEQLVQAPRQPPGICHRVEQFEALYLFFVTQHLLVSFSQCSCTVRKQATENKR